jgi:hypothetical protein
MEIYNLYKNSYKRDEKSINLKNKSGAKSDDDKYRENNTIFTLLNEDVLRECIAKRFAEKGFKVTAEVLYKNKGSGSLDLLITDEKEQDEKNKYYALELKIEKDKDTCGSSIREMISDAHRLVIDKENNYRKKIKDAEKYVVLVIDYINIDSKCNEGEQKTNNRKNTIWGPDFYKLLKNLLTSEPNNKKFNFRELAEKVKSIKTNDTDWKNWLKIVENSSLVLKFKYRIKFDNSKEIILFKCEKKETDSQKKDDISNS